jgi:hypothetical protein
MMKNNIKKLTVAQHKINFLKKFNKKGFWRVGRLYYLSKSTIFISKFNARLLKLSMYLFRQLYCLFRNFNYSLKSYKNFINPHKFVYGNSEKMSPRYFDDDCAVNFTHFSKKKSKIYSKSIALQHMFGDINGVIFFSYNCQVVDLSDDSDFFYKGSIYDNLIFDLDQDCYLFFLNKYDFEYVFEYQTLVIMEIYKINILFLLMKLINLYF